MDPIRVAYFVNSKVRGGVEEHIITLANSLDPARFRPFVVSTPELIGQIRGDLRIPSEDVRPISVRSRFDVGAIASLARTLRASRIDILHSHMFVSTLTAVPAARLAGTPVVIETSHGRETWRFGKWSDRYWLDRLVYRKVDGVIAVSRGCSEYLRDVKRLPEGKVEVVWNGRDLSRFDSARFDGPGLRRRFGLDGRGFVFGTLGRMEPQKNHALLIGAAARLSGRTDAPFVVVIVGDGSLRGELTRLAAEKGVGGRILMPGFQSNPEEWLAAFEAFVLSSDYEGFPLALIEAGAMGLPVVSTKVDGADEIVEDGRSGYLVDIGDAEALADRMHRLLAGSGAAAALGRRLRSFAAANLSLRAQISKTEEYYCRMAGAARST